MTLLLSLAVAAGMATAAAGAPVETFVEAPGPLGALKGTMLAPPTAGGPVILIIPGSGPTDRDGNNPLGVKASTYKLLAEGLAQRGIATVRIDKRGAFASAAAVADGNAVTIADYVSDVKAWTAVIRQRTGAPCVWLLGHSEGGLVALAASKEVPGVCGLLLAATAGRPLGEVLGDQLKANPANAPLLDQALPAIASLEVGRHVDIEGMHPALQQLFHPKLQDFLISLFSYDPAKLLAAYTGPVLILQGNRDLQVGEQDARRLKEASPKARLAVLPDMNHLFKPVFSDDRAANLATYSAPDMPLAANVVPVIADFVLDKGR